MSGDQKRTIRGQGGEMYFTPGRHIDYFDPIPPRFVLEGDNYFPDYWWPARGGDLMIIAPGANLFLNNTRSGDQALESGFWIQNHGRLTTVYRYDQANPTASASGRLDAGFRSPSF